MFCNERGRTGVGGCVGPHPGSIFYVHIEKGTGEITESHGTGHYESIRHRGEDTVHPRREVGGDALTCYPHPSPQALPGFNYRAGRRFGRDIP